MDLAIPLIMNEAVAIILTLHFPTMGFGPFAPGTRVLVDTRATIVGRNADGSEIMAADWSPAVVVGLTPTFDGDEDVWLAIRYEAGNALDGIECGEGRGVEWRPTSQLRLAEVVS